MARIAAGVTLCLGFVESLQLSSPDYFWAGKNGDLMRSGAARPETGAPNHIGAGLDALKAGPVWSWHDAGNALVRAAPLIDGQKNIYLSTIPGRVHKFSPDGVELWSYNGTSSIPEVPCLYKGSIFITNMLGNVTKLDMESGREIWSKPALVGDARGSAGDTWSMTAADGIAISAVSSNWQMNDYLVGMDTETGDVKWSFKPENGVYNSLQDIYKGSIAFSDFTGQVYRLNLTTGDLIWKAGPGLAEGDKPSSSTGGTVLGRNGILYTTSNALRGASQKEGGFVTAFNFSDGNVLWRHATEYVANNGAAVGMMSGRLAIAIGVGVNPDMPVTNPLVRDNDPRLAEKKARVLALDAATGGELWRHELPPWHGWAAGDTISHICLPDSFGNAALSADGTVYVGFQSGAFYGINDKNDDGNIDESEVAMYDTHNAFQGSPGLAPGMVVATPCNGLFVFKAEV